MHLSQSKKHGILPEKLCSDILTWISKFRKHLDDDSVKFIRKQMSAAMEDPFGYFYLLYKIHKTPIKTRPVVSDCASVTHSLGKWVDVMLQPFAQDLPSFFKDSFELKKTLNTINVPPGARLFTCDAESMYTNIDTEAALTVISAFMIDPETIKEYTHYNAATLIAALEIVMRNNILRFGDKYAKQLSGTAMGKPCAPCWAILFQGLDENKLVPTYIIYLKLYLRFIDDVLGLWVPVGTTAEDDEAWASFKARVNNNHGLTWIFTERVMAVNFMDMTISIDNDKIVTTLFEKPMALYLYIPPHSAHPPGVTAGHIFGEILRINRLCSAQDDILERTRTFFRRLRSRGHQPQQILPIFIKAIANAKKYIATSDAERQQIFNRKEEEARRRAYFHVEYHPNSPKAFEIQKLFEDIILRPPGETPFNELGVGGSDIPLDAMVVAYHRPLNLENLFSYRKIDKRDGPSVSALVDK